MEDESEKMRRRKEWEARAPENSEGLVSCGQRPFV